MRYSIELRDRIYVKHYGFFVKNLRKDMGKTISKNLSSNYGQKLLDTTKTTTLLKLSQKKRSNKQQKRQVIWLKILFQKKL